MLTVNSNGANLLGTFLGASKGAMFENEVDLCLPLTMLEVRISMAEETLCSPSISSRDLLSSAVATVPVDVVCAVCPACAVARLTPLWKL